MALFLSACRRSQRRPALFPQTLALLRYFRGMRFALLAARPIAAVILVINALHHAHGWKLPLLPLLISVAYLAVALPHRPTVHKQSVGNKIFEMGIALTHMA